MQLIERLKRLLLAWILAAALPAQATVFVFGDSLSDAGNVYTESIAMGLHSALYPANMGTGFELWDERLQPMSLRRCSRWAGD